MFGFKRSNQDQALLAHAEKMLLPLAVSGLDHKEVAQRIFAEAKAEAVQRFGGDIYSENFGDRAVANTAFLASRKAAGLTEADVRTFWNRPLLMGILEVKVREFIDFLVMDMARQQGRDLISAAQQNRKRHPSYGNPETWDSTLPVNQGLTREDADLFPEFLLRVGRWQEQTPEAEQTVLLAGHSSFNAMVRALVRARKI